jgi:nicotinamidase-related amidase
MNEHQGAEPGGVPAYQAEYDLESGELLPAGEDGRDEATVVAEAAVDYDVDRHGAFEISAPECALIVIDLQEGFVRPGRMWVPHAARVLPRVARFAGVARDRSVPVVFTAATYLAQHPNDTKGYCAPVADGMLGEGSSDVRIATELLADDDYVVQTKYTYNAFFGTELDARLRGRGVRTVIVTGTMTNYCCEATARAAFDLGYHVVFVDDLCATDSAEAHRATVRTLRRGYARVMTEAQVTAALTGPDELYRAATTA